MVKVANERYRADTIEDVVERISTHQITQHDVAGTAVELWSGDPKSLLEVGHAANFVYTFVESGEKTSRAVALFVLVTALSFPLPFAAQQSKQISAPNPAVTSNARFTSGNSATIPLEIDNNIILMRVSVNGSRPMRFIFDTGASLTVLQAKRGAELRLKPEDQLSGKATGGAIEGSLTSGVTLKVAGAEVSNQQIGLIAFPVPPGFEFEGVIGYDFIKEFVIEIDYLQKVMNLYDPRTYRYRGKGEIIPMVVDGRRVPFVNTTIFFKSGPPVEANLEVDTGADRTIIFSSPFVTREKLVARISETTEGRGRGAGGEQKILVGKVKAARLGKFLFSNPPIGLELGTSGKEGDGVVGGEIFRRFKVILDYSRQRMILEPNKSFNDPFKFEDDVTGRRF